jgi:hypothetical protein
MKLMKTVKKNKYICTILLALIVGSALFVYYDPLGIFRSAGIDFGVVSPEDVHYKVQISISIDKSTTVLGDIVLTIDGGGFTQTYHGSDALGDTYRFVSDNLFNYGDTDLQLTISIGFDTYAKTLNWDIWDSVNNIPRSYNLGDLSKGININVQSIMSM